MSWRNVFAAVRIRRARGAIELIAQGYVDESPARIGASIRDVVLLGPDALPWGLDDLSAEEGRAVARALAVDLATQLREIADLPAPTRRIAETMGWRPETAVLYLARQGATS